MILTVCADKGSPGVSTVATVLSMLWPGERVLLEADPSGGDAALRLRTPRGGLLARQLTIRGLSVDARGGRLPASMLAYAQPTSIGVPVIPAADMRSEDLALITRQWPAVAAAAASWPGTVIADLGRLQHDSAAGAVAAASTIVLLICRGTPEGLYHLRERAAALVSRLGQGPHGRSPLMVAVICPARQHPARLGELQAVLAADAGTCAVPVAGWIAQDPRGVQALREGELGKRLTGSELMRSARSVTETLLSCWPQAHPGAPDHASGTGLAPVAAGAAGPPLGPSINAGGWS